MERRNPSSVIPSGVGSNGQEVVDVTQLSAVGGKPTANDDDGLPRGVHDSVVSTGSDSDDSHVFQQYRISRLYSAVYYDCRVDAISHNLVFRFEINHNNQQFLAERCNCIAKFGYCHMLSVVCL